MNIEGVCPVCNTTLPLTDNHDQPSRRNQYGHMQKDYLLRVHGPRGNRCEGSHQKPKPWLEASGLPGWEAMSDADKGRALMHAHKREWEGVKYAVEHYPCRYVDNPLLAALSPEVAGTHAERVVLAVEDGLSDEEFDRLIELA